MSEETESIAPVEDRYAAAGEALGELDDTFDPGETSLEELHDEVVESKEAKTEETENVEEVDESTKGDEQPEEESEEEAEKGEKPANWQWKRLREGRKELKEERAAIQEERIQLQTKTEAMGTLINDIVENPVEGLKALADRVGVDPRMVFDKIIRASVKKGPPSELEQFKEELARKEAEKAKAAEESAKARAAENEAARKAAFVQEEADKAAQIPNNEEASKLYPYLAKMDPAEIHGDVKYAMNWALENNPNATIPQLLTELNKIEGEKQAKLLERYGYTVKKDDESPIQTRQGAYPKKKASRQVVSKPRKSLEEMSPAERIAEAAKVL